MIQSIKTLAKKCLEDKWGEGEILEISQDFSYSYEKLDKSTNEKIIGISYIKEACSFCYNAIKDAGVKSEQYIDDKIDVITCEACLIPRFVCYNKGSEGLMGMLNLLYSKYFSNQEDIKLVIDLVRDCLRQLKNYGKVSITTEKFINSLEVI